MDQLRAVIVTLSTSSIRSVAKHVVFAILEQLGGVVVAIVVLSSKTVPFFFVNPIFRTTHSQIHKYQEEKSSKLEQEIYAPLMAQSANNSTTCYTGGGESHREVLEVRE